ncbi:multidrug-resistance transporte [Scheffersomyces amazonensis]|uniref:multidrug-resistance transporte n=1 Tax=Scheffersomyces amazonensis TaxID=1078765 RepID=UPI00315C8279
MSEQEKDNNTKRFIESDAGDGTKREDQYLHGAHLFACFGAIFLCMFITALDQTIVATVLTTVGNKFNAFGEISWLVSGFMLTLGAFMQMFGKISIIFGRKYSMLVAIVIFELGSLISGVAPNMNTLIGGRVVAGVGASGIQGLSFVIISEVVPIERRPMGMAILSCVFAFASVLGPLVGGSFTSKVSWRWCFYINLPIGAVAFAFLVWAFNPPRPKVNMKEELKRFDYFGSFLLVAGWIILLLALTFGADNYSWNSAAVIVTFILGGGILVIFVIWNWFFSKNQLFANEIIKIPQIMAAVLAITGVFSFSMTSMVYISIYYQVILGYTALHTGIWLLPLSVSVVICSVTAGMSVQKFRYIKPFNIISGLLAPLGAGLLLLYNLDRHTGKQIGISIVIGAATGFQIQPSILAAQVKAPKTPGSTIMVTTFVAFCRSIGSAVGTALGNVIYSVSLKNAFTSSFSNPKPGDASIIQELAGMDINRLVSDSSFIAALSPEAQLFVKQQIMHAIKNVFYFCIGLSVIGTVSSFFVTNQKLPKVSGRVENKDEEEGKEKNDTVEGHSEDDEIIDLEDKKKVESKENTVIGSDSVESNQE